MGNIKRSILSLWPERAVIKCAAVPSLTFERLNCSFVINGLSSFPPSVRRRSTAPPRRLSLISLFVRVGKVGFRLVTTVFLITLAVVYKNALPHIYYRPRFHPRVLEFTGGRKRKKKLRGNTSRIRDVNYFRIKGRGTK